MLKTLLSATALGAAIMFGASAAHAADFVCPDMPTDDASAKIVQEFLGSADLLDKPDQLNAAIDALSKAGVSQAMIINEIVNAYCPTVAANDKLSSLQKTLRVQKVAAEVTKTVFNITSEDAVIIDVPLPPTTVDKINALAKEAGVTPAEWIAGLVEASTSAQ